MGKWADRERLPRQWRKFEEQPTEYFDWPDPDWLAVECAGDPIIVYDRCNGYSLWRESDEVPPPAEFWIAMPDRDELYEREKDQAA